jgi:dihydrofolate reductase
MSKVIVFTNLSVDGVMQAPGRPDEDRRDGFAYGGWAVPYAAMSHAGESMANIGALLLGRRTYEDFYSVWPQRTGDPMAAMLDNLQKYVVSTTLAEPLPWVNSTLLKGEAAEKVGALKEQSGQDLVIMGSGELVHSLRKANLIDTYVLLIHPLILGSGRRLFPEGDPFGSLQLVRATTTEMGVVIATYQPTDNA